MHLYDSWGHYRWRGLAFFDRFALFEAAKAAGDPAPAIEFVWPLHDRLIDKTIEPSESLLELYAARARELRETYDYLMLMYSGGHDSTQMLETFLQAGLFVDEVVTYYPLGLIEKLAVDRDPNGPMAYLHEFKLAAIPGLKRLATASPHTKITLWDTTSAYTGTMDDWVECPGGPRPSGGLHGLFHSLKKWWQVRETQRVADGLGGKRVAVINAVDKPYLQLVGDELFLYFTDAGRMGIENFLQHGSHILYDPILFYWGDPVIPIKQAHVIKRALEGNPLALAAVPDHGMFGVDKNIPGLNHSIIYPYWDGRFQALNKSNERAILDGFFGPRARGAAEARNRFFNDQYKSLTGINQLRMGWRGRSGYRGYPTKLYSLGILKKPVRSSEVIATVTAA